MKISIVFTKLKLKSVAPERIKILMDNAASFFEIIMAIPKEQIVVNVYEGENRNPNIIAVIILSDITDEYGAKLLFDKIRAELFTEIKECYDEAGVTEQIVADNIYIEINDDFISTLKNGSKSTNRPESAEEFDYKKRAEQYIAEEPKFTFERLIIPESTRIKIEEALAVLQYKKKLFDEWALSVIMSPSVLINFYGASGTGKTMAAEAIADKLGKKIIRATYADIESKYHGEGPKMLKAIFFAAEKQDAVLFIDEADSMLSARLQNVSQGSEQAINSMRSQLLISLESYNGIVIFATNLIENYDSAFLTRLMCIEFKRPDAEERKQIWSVHLFPVKDRDNVRQLNIPLDNNVDIDILAEKYDLCGRDIRGAVKTACINAVINGCKWVSQAHLEYACEKTIDELQALENAKNKGWDSREAEPKPLSPKEQDEYETKLAKKIIEKTKKGEKVFSQQSNVTNIDSKK